MLPSDAAAFYGAWRRREFGAGETAEIEALPARLLVDEIYLGFRP
jgi:hypothetical protein